MSKTLTALLVALLLVAAGCGGGDAPAPTTPSSGSSAGDAAFGKTTPPTTSDDFDEQPWTPQPTTPAGTTTPTTPVVPTVPSGANRAPQVAGIALDPSGTTVPMNGTVRISVSASDADGDALQYTWGATGGTFDSTDGYRAVWRAPQIVGSFVVNVMVSDGKGGSTPAQQSFTVVSNNSPAISSFSLSATSVAPGGSVIASGTASDPDGDPVSYKWSADGGTITGTGQNVTWLAPQAQPGEQSEFHIQLKVEDGRGGSDQRVETVTIVFGYVTETFNVVPASTGTVIRNGGSDTTRTRAGDDATNESFRAFWTFDLGKVKSSDVTQATLSFTHKQTVGDPFRLENLQLGLGGIRVWIVRYDSTKLPRYGAETITEVQELFVPELAGEPLRTSPSSYDITPYVQRIGQNMATDNYVQIMVGFQKTTQNDNVEDSMEWSNAAIAVTYAPV